MSIYLDNNAATPVDPRVLTAFVEAAQNPGNPSSTDNAAGVSALSKIEEAGQAVAALVGASSGYVTFVPGSTAGLRLAIDAALFGAENATVLVGEADHSAILKYVRELGQAGKARPLVAPIDRHGRLNAGALASILERERPRLVCLLAANNEVGTVEDLASAISLSRLVGAKVLVDASQAAGKVPLSTDDLQCDYLVLSGAKIYGLSRTAAIVSTRRLDEMAHARFGSPDATGAVALGVACNLRSLEMAEDEHRIRQLRDTFEQQLGSAFPDAVINGDPNGRLAGTSNFAVPGALSDAVLARLHGRVDISSGAACESRTPGPSHVLRAMGAEEWVLDGSLRVGIGKFNSSQELEEATKAIIEAIEDSRRARARKTT